MHKYVKKGRSILKRCLAMALSLSMVLSIADIGITVNSIGNDAVAAGSTRAAQEDQIGPEDPNAAGYIYFHNGLAGFDKVEYSINGGEFVEMELLAAHADRKPAGDDKYITSSGNNEYGNNINLSVYVTPVKIDPYSDAGKTEHTKIVFRGTASGTVYDTTSNYQPNTASREWGYDYIDFVWTSDPVTVGAVKNQDMWDWDCYFAPALAMQNKYIGENGETFIKPVKAADAYHENGTDNHATLEIELNPSRFVFGNGTLSYETVFAGEASTITILDGVAYSKQQKSFAAILGAVTVPGGMTTDASEEVSEDTVTSDFEDDYETIANDDGIALFAMPESTNMQLTGKGDLLTVVSNEGGEITIYASADLSINGASEAAEATSSAVNSGSETIYEITATLTAGERYVISSDDTVTIYSVEIGSDNLETLIENQTNPVISDGVATTFTKLTDGTVNVTNTQPALLKITTNGKGSIEFKKDGTAADVYYKEDKNTFVYNMNDVGNYSFTIADGEIVSVATAYVKETGTTEIFDSGYTNGTDITEQLTKFGFFTLIYARGNNPTVKGREITFGGSGGKDNRAIIFEMPTNGVVSFDAQSPNTSSDREVVIASDNENIKDEEYVFDAPGASANKVSFPVTKGTWYIYGRENVRISNLSVKYANPSPEGTFALFNTEAIYPESGRNRTFVGHKYTMEGETGSVNNPNRIGEKSVVGGSEGSYAIDNSATINDGAGLNYLPIQATVYDYFSDWELSGKKLADHTEASAFANSTSTVNKGTTFTKNTNTISYSYQGDLWNQAISDFYSNTNVVPVYFGSNSNMTGNGNYNTFNSEKSATWSFAADEFMKKNKDNYFVYDTSARGYFDTLHLGDSVVAQVAHGLSNSRGIYGLVKGSELDGSVALAGSADVSPYFNEDFIKGNNPAGVVYGNVYNNVQFHIKKEGDYFVYNSALNNYSTRLTYNTVKNKYYMDYVDNGVMKSGDEEQSGGVYKPKSGKTYQYYPFNSNAASSSYAKENLMFGAKLSVPLATYKKNADRSGMFKFSGDDDVWVYIRTTDEKNNSNTELIMDIGGTHAARGGVADMNKMLAVVETTYDPNDPSYGYSAGNNTPTNGTSWTTNLGGSSTDQKKLETIAFVIATADGIEATNGFVSAPQNAEWFGTSYSTDSTIKYKAEIVNDPTTGEPKYFDVYLSGSGKVGGVQLPSGGCVVRYGITSFASAFDKAVSNGGETISYDVDIYFMERGLNSSNLKFAVKGLEATTRTYEKQWIDDVMDFYNHDGVVNGKNESVRVGLYRERVTEAGEPTVYTRDDMFVRASVYNNGAEPVSQSGFTKVGDQVDVEMTVDKSTKYLALALSGAPLTNNVFKWYTGAYTASDNNKGNGTLVVEVDGNIITDFGADGIIDIQKFGDSQDHIVKIKFDVLSTVGQIRSVKTTDEKGGKITEESWGIEEADAWLIECYPLESESLSGKLTRGSVKSLQSKGTDLNTTVKMKDENSNEREVKGEDMRFIIVSNPNAASGKGTYMCNDYFVYAAYKEDAFEITDNITTTNRRVYYLIKPWTGIFNIPMVHNNDIGTCDSVEVNSTIVVKSGKNTTNDYYFTTAIVEDSVASDIANYPIDPIDGKSNSDALNRRKVYGVDKYSYYEENITTVLEYMDGHDYVLDKNASYVDFAAWFHQWNDRADYITVDGKVYKYNYYITAEVDSSEYVLKYGDVTNTYYMHDGKPTVKSEVGEQTMVYTYTCDSQGRVVEITQETTVSSYKTTVRYLFTYDEKGNVVKVEKSSHSGVTSVSYVYNANKKGEVKSVTRITAAGSEKISIKNFTLDFADEYIAYDADMFNRVNDTFEEIKCSDGSLLRHYTTKYFTFDGDNFIAEVTPEEAKEYDLVTSYYEEGDDLSGGHQVGDIKDTEKRIFTFVEFDEAQDEAIVRALNIPVADLEIFKHWQLHVSDTARNITEQEPEDITIYIYRRAVNKSGTVLDPGYEVYKTLEFKPIMDSDAVYQGRYNIYVDGEHRGSNVIAEVVRSTQQDSHGITVKNIDWHYTLYDVPLYDANMFLDAENTIENPNYGAKYEYFAVEAPLTNNTEDLETRYVLSKEYPIYDNNGKLVDVPQGEDIEPAWTLHPFLSDDGSDDPYGTYNNGVFSMNIYNIIPPKPFDMEIMKVDKETGLPVEGAEFTLYVKDSLASDRTYIELGRGTTNKDGSINFKLTELQETVEEFRRLDYFEKTYKLVETVVPKGYDRENVQVSFTFKIDDDGYLNDIRGADEGTCIFNYCEIIPVDENGDSLLDDEGKFLENKTYWDVASYKLQLHLVNTRITFVNTGGAGTHMLIMVGVAMIVCSAGAFGYLYADRKRKKRKAA